MTTADVQMFRKNPALFIEETIKEYVFNSPKNYFMGSRNEPLFDEPLVSFADGDDPIFQDYKKIIGDFHLTPREALEKYRQLKGDKAYRQPPHVSVIVWVLPINYETRLSLRRETIVPSLRWNHMRWQGIELAREFDAYLVSLLEELGHKAVAPMCRDIWKELELPNGWTSTWSHRHAAYAAGLGTFSLNDAFITPRGIAHRMSSAVCDIALPYTPRVYTNHLSNCLFYKDGSCVQCIQRCPVGAISEKGHDKKKCKAFTSTGQREILRILGREKDFGGNNPGCGFCQTKVPCEFRIPDALSKDQK